MMDNRNFVADWTRAINFAWQSSFARTRRSGETPSVGPLEIGLSLPLFFCATPRTPLRVLGIIALDTLHVLRHSRPLPRVAQPVMHPSPHRI
jgi:hypothetical protein